MPRSTAPLPLMPMPPKGPGVPEAVYELQQVSQAFMMKYLAWSYIAMVPVWALFARWHLRRGGFNYAECLIIVAFLTAINNFFALLWLPVTHHYSGTAQVGTASVVFMCLILPYSSWAYGSLLSHTTLSRAGRLWRGFLTFLMGYLTCILVMVILTYALNWTTFKKAMQEQMQLQTSTARPAAAPAAP